MAVSIRFDQSAPYEVDEADVSRAAARLGRSA
jgi:hypothetical protein